MILVETKITARALLHPIVRHFAPANDKISQQFPSHSKSTFAYEDMKKVLLSLKIVVQVQEGLRCIWS